MSISRRVLQIAAVSGLVAGLTVPAAAAFADSAAPQPDQQTVSSPSPATSQSSSDQGKEQQYSLSNGAQAHVYSLPDGSYMAWITVKGQRVANLSSGSGSSTVNGYRYILNQANGFVGVVHPDGWHSEQDKPDPAHQKKHPDNHQKDQKIHPRPHQDTRDQRTAQHDSQTGATRDKGTSAAVAGGREGRLPQGGVRAGAEGASSHGSDTPLIVAAGGGLALAGAGFGYLVVRRGRREES
ncbi:MULTISPECIES: hypothetical protein [unclassified Streptomyces]|uniref:hypothetical protein n=1 Tax=unclassified Streptomyces TaxID=2593676 RepID=UPI000DBA2147|nr:MULTISPECIES: hypothetical protein [unclassified Streptomyces]MYT73447.1 hypothetical protein [Streptomyces sp. SID8367]RAJ84976.1 hypothetical protein K377_03457 [Streptomyces sp. PsTaAH-137]